MPVRYGVFLWMRKIENKKSEVRSISGTTDAGRLCCDLTFEELSGIFRATNA